MPTIVATPGASNANSYLTVAEGNTYFESRVAVAGWDDADSKEALLIMATRLMDATYSGARIYVPPSGSHDGYYKIGPKWTGAPASSTQSLAWPRIGMFDRNGNAISSTVIPQALKDATAELAGALGTKDLTVDNDIAVQGISSVSAGSVAVSFTSGGVATTKIIPDVVYLLLVPSWLTDEVQEGTSEFMFRVL